MMELAYSLLLGWMSTLTDWFWALLSGGGGSEFFAWLLEHWKIWLAVIIIGGLVLDGLIHFLRWQPYKVWFRRPLPEIPIPAEKSIWDEPEEEEADLPPDETEQWTDLMLPMLSEIDENWAQTASYQPIADIADPADQPTRLDLAPRPYLEEDEEKFQREDGFYTEEEEETRILQPIWQQEEENVPESTQVFSPAPAAASSWEEETIIARPQSVFEPAPVQPVIQEEPAAPQDSKPDLSEAEAPAYAEAPLEPHTPAPAAEDYEPSNQAARRRRRRSIRESEQDLPPAFQTPPTPEKRFERPADTIVPRRMEDRLIQEDANGLQTVTGRPAIRRGLLRFTMSSEEPIAGLPPMRVEGGGFHPAARPESPDFEQDVPAAERDE